MATWTKDELNKIGRADELQIAPLKSDDTTREPTTVWVVRDGDELLVRAFHGRDGVWYRAAAARHAGHISAGGVERDVIFVEEDDPARNDRLDDAYRGKYARFGDAYVDPMVADTARAATLKLVPR